MDTNNNNMQSLHINHSAYNGYNNQGNHNNPNHVMIPCPNCGRLNFPAVKKCVNCSKRIPKKESGLGIAALVLTLICCTFWIGLLLAIIDLIVGRNGGDGKGHICSWISLVLGGVLAIMCVISSCSNKLDSYLDSKNEAVEETTIAEETVPETENEDVKESDVPSDEKISEEEEIVEAESEPELIETQVGNIVFVLSDEYVKDSTNSSSDGIAYMTKLGTSFLTVAIDKGENNITEEMIEEKKDAFDEIILDELEQNVSSDRDNLVCTREGNLDGSKVYEYVFDDPRGVYIAGVIIDEDGMYMIGFGHAERDLDDLYDEFDKIISDSYYAKGDGTSASNKSDTTDTNDDSSSSSSSSNNVSADFKKTMDDYEAMIDKYCEVMQKYQNTDEPSMEMYADYFDMLEQYSKAMEGLSSIDVSSLDASDYLYYIEVMERINKKLESIS